VPAICQAAPVRRHRSGPNHPHALGPRGPWPAARRALKRRPVDRRATPSGSTSPAWRCLLTLATLALLLPFVRAGLRPAAVAGLVAMAAAALAAFTWWERHAGA